MAKTKRLVIGGLTLSLLAGAVHAAVSPEQAARLGGPELTPIGAERAGNGNEIPEWKDEAITPPASYEPGKHHVDPFPDDPVLFTIDASNVDQYKDKLSPGQVATIQKYSDTYKLPVYQTRRTSTYPQKVYDAAKKNALNVSLTDTLTGVTRYDTAFPFPILSDDAEKAGIQAIFNHVARYRGGSLSRVITQATPLANGNYSLVTFEEEVTFLGELQQQGESDKDNIVLFFKQKITSPSRLAGNVLLVHETLDQLAQPRLAWVYNAGQRRVRRAPQVAYDGPGTAADGMRTADNFDMYNGSPDRYKWTYMGKKEMYIPYNNYKLASSELDYSDIIKPGHINQDLTRYELHRVHHVVGVLREGQRHIYSKRELFIDEDSWQMAAIDHYDGRGELWRVAEAFQMNFYDAQAPWFIAETLYDLIASRYVVFGLHNEESNSYEFERSFRESNFTPAALRRAGVR